MLSHSAHGSEAAHAPAREDLLKILLYFDIFHYPLTRSEMMLYLPGPAGEKNIDLCLDELVKNGELFFHSGFYSIQNNPLLAVRRKQGNERARQLLKKGLKIGKFLYRFPFVRAVGISGSLSKNFADEKADIDFFIITRANRLWLARTFMHLYKKLTFLTGRQHYYCMNYYVDEKALLLEEKNIFTAIEIKTLLPVRGTQTLYEFNSVNEWSDSWLPAFPAKKQESPDRKAGLVKKIIEWIFNNKTGDRLDNIFLQITRKRWAQKGGKGKRNAKGLPMDLVTGKHFAWSNPGSFREKVLESYHQKLKEYKLV